jgi:peptide chain release factor 3
MAGDELDMDKVLKGELTPVFFGSAITNFGVEPFLQHFLKMSPGPAVHHTSDGMVEPEDTMFSGFVFKIQANMDPSHRDRMAFIRICSGQYEKNMTVNLMRTGKKITLAQPQQFMAQDRAITEEAYAGDIIGIFDPGNFRIGDTIISTNRKFEFDPIPVFAPENFARVEPKDSMKRKQFLKGIEQLSQEGAVQLYKQPNIGTETYVMGVVGILQFDVLEYRLKSEYNVDIVRTPLPYRLARWAKSDVEGFDPKELTLTSTSLLVLDRDNAPVVLFESEWAVDWAIDHNEKMKLSFENINSK